MDDIRYIIPREFQDLSQLARKCSGHNWVRLGELQHRQNSQALVVWDYEHLDVVAVDSHSLAGGQISEVVDRHNVNVRQVCFDLRGQEAIDL